MMEKVPKQKYVDIWPTPFQNNDHIGAQIENTGKMLVPLQPKSLLHSVVNLILEANSIDRFNLLTSLK